MISGNLPTASNGTAFAVIVLQTLLCVVMAPARPPREPTIIEDGYGNPLFIVEHEPSRPAKASKRTEKKSPSNDRPPRCPSGMVYIPGGEFKKRPVSAFCLDAREVTAGEFVTHVAKMERGSELTKRGMSELKHALETADWLLADPPVPKRTPYCTFGRAAQAPNLPINCVSHAEAEHYCRSHGKRLPSEREWQWAARGRKARWVYPWGKGPVSEFANTAIDGAEPRLADVETRKPSPDRLYDMGGNVWEWIAGDATATRYAARGGSFRARSLREVRVTSEVDVESRTARSDEVGFRCAGPAQTREPAP